MYRVAREREEEMTVCRTIVTCSSNALFTCSNCLVDKGGGGETKGGRGDLGGRGGGEGRPPHPLRGGDG